MADAFAPQLGTEVRFNQPIEQAPQSPSMFGALAELGGSFLQSLGSSRQSRGSAAPKVDTNLATFRAGLEKVEAIRQERGETAAQVAERQLASNFAMAGINFDAAYEDVYTTTTGRQWAGYGQDVQATMLQETLKDPVVQSSYIAGLAVLGPDATEDQLIEYAIGQKATLEAANNEIAKSKAQAGYTWSVSTEAAYGANIDNFLNTSLGALSVNSQQGGRVSPMDVQNMKGQWSQLKVALSRPPNISDDQWKSTQDKIANIDSLLTTFEKASSSEALLEELSTAIATSITAGKEGDLQALIAGASAAKDINLFANLTGVDFATTLMDAGKGLKLDVTQQDLFGHILDDQSSLVGVEDPNSFLSTIPDTVKTRIEGKTPEEIFNGLDASGKLAGLVKPADLNRPEAKEQFVTNAATIGAVLMNNPSESFLSDSALKQLIANPGFIRNVIALDAIDPEGATVARQYVRSGLNIERGRQVTNFGTIEAYLQGKGIVWNGTAYALTPEAEASGPRVVPSFGGMGAITLSPLQENAEFIRQAMDRRAAIVTIDRAMKALEVPTAETTIKAGGAGSGSSSTANPITYALPEAIAADTEFLDKVVSVSSELGFDPNDLLRVIDFETAGSFSPKAQPIRKDGTKISSATGLIQFLEKTANGLGTTTAELAGMTAVEQLDFVKDYFEPFKGRIKNFGDIYMAVHWPAGVGKDDSYVMYKAGSDSYKANKGLDTNGDGTVTRGETLARLFSATGKGGNPTAGTPANENTVAAAAGPAVQRAVAPSGGSPSSDMTMPSGGAPTAPMATGEAVDATLPEAIPAETPTGTQGTSELSPAIAVDKDVQAFIQEIAGDPDKTYASAEEFTAAQERGELEPGDTVVVNEEIYVIRKDGSARKLGSLTP